MGSSALATHVVAGLIVFVVPACGGAPSTSPPAPPRNTTSARTQLVYEGNDCTRRHPGTGPARASLERRGGAVALARLGDELVAYLPQLALAFRFRDPQLVAYLQSSRWFSDPQ